MVDSPAPGASCTQARAERKPTCDYRASWLTRVASDSTHSPQEPSRSTLRVAELPLLCRFLDAGGTETLRTLGGPASKKRRGAKSRDAGQRLGVERYGDFRLAAHAMQARHRGGAARIPARGDGRK